MLNTASLVTYLSKFSEWFSVDTVRNGVNATVTGTVTSPLVVSMRVYDSMVTELSVHCTPVFHSWGVWSTIHYGDMDSTDGQYHTIDCHLCLPHFRLVCECHYSAIKSTNLRRFLAGRCRISGRSSYIRNSWTHVGYTYSSTNGIRLYINGTYFSTSGAFSSSASGNPMYMAIGSNFGSNTCSPGYGGYFNGVADEFYLYSRELTCALYSCPGQSMSGHELLNLKMIFETVLARFWLEPHDLRLSTYVDIMTINSKLKDESE